jgi:hypothetical protein
MIASSKGLDDCPPNRLQPRDQDAQHWVHVRVRMCARRDDRMRAQGDAGYGAGAENQR